MNFASQLTYWWFNGLVVQGYRKALERKDLWSLNPWDRSSYVVPQFEEQWSKELLKHARFVTYIRPPFVSLRRGH